jgi:hypothetical protein
MQGRFNGKYKKGKMNGRSEFLDVSLNNWIRHLPPQMVSSHLNLDQNAISKSPAAKVLTG